MGQNSIAPSRLQKQHHVQTTHLWCLCNLSWPALCTGVLVVRCALCTPVLHFPCLAGTGPCYGCHGHLW